MSKATIPFESIYHAESRRVLATLIRLLGDFDLAEEALHEAFVAAMEQWPRTAFPPIRAPGSSPTGRFKAIDTLRRRARFDAALERVRESSRGRDAGRGGRRS